MSQRQEKFVIKITTPTRIEIDLNSNQVYDDGETICIPNLETFTTDFNSNQYDLSDKLKLTFEDSIKLGYITDNYVESILSNKAVKIVLNSQKDQNCQYGDIIVDNQSYSKKLKNSGLAFIEGKPTNEKAYQEQLKLAKKLNLVILNHTSNKYHTLNCKYGKIAHDKVLMQVKNLPQKAKPCKYCNIKNSNNINNRNNKIKNNLKTYPLRITNGNIKMFLTDLTTTLRPDDRCNSLVCKELLNQIENSQNSIDIALYGWTNIPKVIKALEDAKARGVKIRIVYDKSRKDIYPDTHEIVKLADLSAYDTPQILMHNKFIIIDNQNLITGSMNFSATGLSGFNANCVLIINSKDLAKIYTEEFEQMINWKFHGAKNKVNHKTLILNGTKITPFFSPKDSTIQNEVIPLINNAKKYIYIPAFIITHNNLTQALINAKKRGVDVRLIIDATNTYSSHSTVSQLRKANIPVKIENYAGKIHSKSIIIDDKYILAGSMNLSHSGENKNDENSLIIEDSKLAKYYKEFFIYLWMKIPDKYLKQIPRAEGHASIGSCTDGIDNDYDLRIDGTDTGCQ